MRPAAFCLFLFTLAAAFQGDAAEMSIGRNFTVIAPDQAVADAIAARAEVYREQAAQDWLGAKLPDRHGRSLIAVDIKADKDEGATWPIDCPERTLHQVSLTTSVDRALGSTLHHEVTHTVLDTYSYPEFLPAWASEGIASQVDDAGRQEHQRQLLRRWSESGQWPSLQTLFATPRIGHDNLNAYAASSSVTEFLAERRGKPRVVEFALAGPRHGWDHAAHDCFGFRDVGDLQTAWQTWVAGKVAN